MKPTAEQIDDMVDAFEEGMLPNLVEEFEAQRVEGLRALLHECESPIECKLAYALAAQRGNLMEYDWVSGKKRKYFAVLPAALQIIAQYPIGRFRVDFAIKAPLWNGPALQVAIECDGHDFHERTKQQAARDRSKDRLLTQKGWTVLRFTGSEIHNKPAECAKDVSKTVEAFLIDDWRRANG
ncbi:DUF559 domain-containing protein [Henriciella sp.]|uniref:endonuclease domain-containing protein n=1 Tax=Henriciella sp. TaxID=1968823 RepID=UPI00260D558A|nr:DUF559 domain-containing protein [Henriciella sp.]